MKIQTLEARVLFSIALDPDTGILRWTGTGGNDYFEVSPNGSMFNVKEGDEVNIYTGVEYIIANGRSGDDKIMISPRLVLPTILNGGDGNDTIHGGFGADYLIGGNGDDSLNGNQGGDRVDYSNSFTSVTFDLSTTKGLLKGTAQFGTETDTLNNIDLVVGSGFEDTFNLTGVGASPSGYIIGDLYGWGQEQKIADLGSNESLPAIHAGNGNDIFNFTGVVAARSFGDAGEDAFRCTVDPTSRRPFAWVDYIDGGEGTDTQSIAGQFGSFDGKTVTRAGGILNRMYPNIEVGSLSGADFGPGFYGNELDNSITSFSSPMAIHGGVGGDSINIEGGTTVQVSVYGNEGDDIIDAHDLTSGINGIRSVLVHGDNGSDTITGSGGNDKIFGDRGEDELHGFEGDDYLYDGAGAGNLFGDGGNDTLVGYNQFLFGGEGDDTLQSNGGSKDYIMRFEGGAGNDLFFVRDGSKSVVLGGTGSDRARVDGRFDRVSSIELFL